LLQFPFFEFAGNCSKWAAPDIKAQQKKQGR